MTPRNIATNAPSSCGAVQGPLQRFETLRYGTARDFQLRSGMTEVSHFHDGSKCLQLLSVENHILSNEPADLLFVEELHRVVRMSCTDTTVNYP